MRSALAGAASSSQLKADLSLSASPRRARLILFRPKRHSCERRISTPPLDEAHEKARIEFVGASSNLNEAWKAVLFADEKNPIQKARWVSMLLA